LVIAVTGVLSLGTSALADPSGQSQLYWWPAQVSHDQKSLSVIFDSSCSSSAPRALVGETTSSVTIELLGTQSTQCQTPPTFAELRVPLTHRLGGRPIVGSRADPNVPGGAPTRDVAGTTSAGSPRAPQVVGFNAMDAKLALRRAGLTPHATSSSLSAEVTRQQQAAAAPQKVLLATAPRPRTPAAPAATQLSLGAATPALTAAPSTPPPPAAPAAPPATCANTDLVPNSSNLDQVGTATMCLVNQQRAQAGLAPLTGEMHLQIAADQHSLDMVVANYFSHTTPSGEPFSTRLLASGYVPADTAYALGENIAWGTGSLSTPASIVTAWMNSPEHRANILDPQYTQTGMSIVPAVPAIESQAAGATYTQEFGALG
jgi:uncharacterized protein YkwD